MGIRIQREIWKKYIDVITTPDAFSYTSAFLILAAIDFHHYRMVFILFQYVPELFVIFFLQATSYRGLSPFASLSHQSHVVETDNVVEVRFQAGFLSWRIVLYLKCDAAPIYPQVSVHLAPRAFTRSTW